MTPQHHIIMAALVHKAAQIEIDLDVGNKSPSALQLVLHNARTKAIVACEALIYCDPGDTKIVVQLQNEVRLFVDLVEAAQQIIEEADQATSELSEEDREVVSDLVLHPRQAAAHSGD